MSKKQLAGWTVVGGLASVAGLFCAFLALRPNQKRQDADPVSSASVTQHAASVQVNGSGPVNVAGHDLVMRDLVQKVYPPPEKFVDKVFLKADESGEAPKILTTPPSEIAHSLINSKDPLTAARAILTAGFSSEAGTEVELLENQSQKVDPWEQGLRPLYARVRLASGPAKGTVGWVRMEQLEHRQVRENAS
jgi:hypothetical protein